MTQSISRNATPASVIPLPVVRLIQAHLPDYELRPGSPDLAEMVAIAREKEAVRIEQERIDDELSWLEYITLSDPEEALRGAAQVRQDIESLDERRIILATRLYAFRR